jgi:ribokinase
MADVVVLGDVNVDIIAEFSSYPVKGEDALAHASEIHCGGSAANTAMALARMGISTSLISRVGPDSWGLRALDCLREAGVDLSGIQQDPVFMTGTMYVVVTPDGERTLLGNRGANVNTDPEQIQPEVLTAARLFHLSGYALLSEPQRSAALQALELARRRGLAITLDPGLLVTQTALDVLLDWLPAVHILLPSLAEARTMTGLIAPEACCRALLRRGVQVVALKLGKDGCLLATDRQVLFVPGFVVDVRDSTGAGDSFAAGLIAGFVGGLDWQAAALLATAMGAVATMRMGAAIAEAQVADARSLLQEPGDRATDAKDLEAREQAAEFIRTLPREPEREGVC